MEELEGMEVRFEATEGGEEPLSVHAYLISKFNCTSPPTHPLKHLYK